MACAVGAASVEGAEAASAIPTWNALQERVEAGDCASIAQTLSCVFVRFSMLVKAGYLSDGTPSGHMHCARRGDLRCRRKHG